MATKTQYGRIALLSQTKASWSSTVVLLKGEIGIETDTGKFKIGDGTSTWAELDYANPDVAIATSSVVGGIVSSTAAGNVQVDSSTGIATISDAVGTGSGAKGLMTAAQAVKLEGIEASADVNVLEGVQFKGSKETSFSDLTIDSNKKVQIDLSNYPTFSDISSALNFKGSKTGAQLAALTSEDVSNGDVYTCTSDSGNFHEGLEYAAVVEGSTLTWTELGKYLDLSGYVQKTQKVNGIALSGDVTLDGADIALDGYSKATTASAIATSDTVNAALGKLEKKADDNASAITTLNGADTVEGSVAKSIKDAVEALDGTQTAGYYVTSVTEANGIVTSTREAKGAVASGVTALVDGGTVYAVTSKKADLVDDAVAGNFAGLDADGNLTDSGKKATDFVTVAQGSANANKILKVNSTGSLELSDISAIGVTSVTGTAPVSATTSDGAVTVSLANGYGDTKNPYAAKNANTVLAGPTSGSSAAPSFRALVAGDIPTLTPSKVQLSGATVNNVATLDASGSYKDSGVGIADLIDVSEDITLFQCTLSNSVPS